MELRTTRELRRNEQLSKATPKKADAAATLPPAQKQPHGDKLTLSRQALDYLEEQNRKMWEWGQEREERKDGRISGLLDAMEGEKQKLDNMSKALDMMNKCQKIAAAIMRGDRVPPEDLQYLMEHDQEGYKMALAMRKPKKDPEDVESVLDDEDRKAGSAEGADSGGESPEVSAPEAADRGGEVSAVAE